MQRHFDNEGRCSPDFCQKFSFFCFERLIVQNIVLLSQKDNSYHFLQRR